MVSPGLMWSAGGIAPEKLRWKTVGSKTCVLGAPAAAASRRAFQSNSSFPCLTAPAMSSP